MVDNRDDVIDVRDLIDRFEELESRDVSGISDEADLDADPLDKDERQELDALDDVLTQLRGNGGDHQWQGAWYPVTLVHDDYFETYARELADDLGAVPSAPTWPLGYIDWEAAAAALQVDYFSVDFDGETYWTR